MLWIERGMNAKHPAHSRETYIRFNKLLIGSCAGLVLATVVLFPTQVDLSINGIQVLMPPAYYFMCSS